MKRLFYLLTVAIILETGATVAFPKPFPTGIVDLPGSVNAKSPIGAIDAHPWLNPNVDGIRIRTGWDNTETADGIFNWVQIDECLANAATSGKFIGLSLIAGLSAPPWLMGGVSFTDGSTTLNVATLTSLTANFVAADVGKVIVCANFPAGTTIVSRVSSTVVQTSSAATKASTTKKPAALSILARNTGGAAFRVLTAPDSGVMVIPWDPVAKAKFKETIIALGAKYDQNPQLGYFAMTGFCQAGEAYLASTQADIDFFNASAVAAGYSPTADLPAGLVAWEAVVKEIVAQYMISFPTTPLLITGARPFGGPEQASGTKAMNDIFAWGVATYPGRFGIMNSQLHVSSGVGYFLNAAIYANHLTQPVGIQFLCSSSVDNIARLSNAPPYGSSPLLPPAVAMDLSLTAGVSFGCNFVEVYEYDINTVAYQSMFGTYNAILNQTVPPSASAPQAPTNLHVF